MDEFDEICRRCTPVVYRFLLSLCKDASLADELTAETFYQAYLHIDTFRGNCRVESVSYTHLTLPTILLV